MNEVSAVCLKCGHIADIGCRTIRGTLIIEPRQDITLMLIHKPNPINDTPACGGQMCLIAPEAHDSVAQEERLPYSLEDDISLLRECIGLMDKRQLPPHYLEMCKLRAEGKRPGEIGNALRMGEASVYHNLSEGDRVIAKYGSYFRELVINKNQI